MGNEFTNEIVNGSIPIEYIAGVQTGIESALQFGVLAGFPVVDVKVALVDGAYHDVDSSLLAFEIAARVALHEALLKGAPVLLEPIMEIEIVTPRDCMTVIIDDLRKRRGRITAQALAANTIVLKATVRLATLFGYAKYVRSINRAEALLTLRFEHYAPAPWPEDPTFRPAMGMRA